MKKYYLIAQWFPQNGQTIDAPACVFGPSNYIPPLPLHNVDPSRCYKSESRAWNVASKYMGHWGSYAVIEVPQSAFTA